MKISSKIRILARNGSQNVRWNIWFQLSKQGDMQTVEATMSKAELSDKIVDQRKAKKMQKMM